MKIYHDKDDTITIDGENSLLISKNDAAINLDGDGTMGFRIINITYYLPHFLSFFRRIEVTFKVIRFIWKKDKEERKAKDD